jgi:hypothetical protein
MMMLRDVGEEMEIRDANGRYRHARRAPVDEYTSSRPGESARRGWRAGGVSRAIPHPPPTLFPLPCGFVFSPYESIPPHGWYLWRWLCHSCAIRSSRVYNFLDWLGLSFFPFFLLSSATFVTIRFVPLPVWLASFARFSTSDLLLLEVSMGLVNVLIISAKFLQSSVYCFVPRFHGHSAAEICAFTHGTAAPWWITNGIDQPVVCAQACREMDSED